MVRLYRTFSNYSSSGDTRCAGCKMHRLGEVQAQRTSSNLLELHPHRDSKVYRLLSQEFGVVRLVRTFSDCSFTGARRSEGARCTSWKRFKHIEPQRTFSNYILKHFEPQQTFSNYFLTELARYIARLLSHKFGVVRLDRTFSDYIFTGDRTSAGCTRHRFREL